MAANDGPAVAEVCRRFGVTERELLADLDLLFLCGVYPFTPDALIEVDIADGRVWIRFADYFRRPLRLTPPEGLALVGAGSALLARPRRRPRRALARALAKLATVLGVGADDASTSNWARSCPVLLAWSRPRPLPGAGSSSTTTPSDGTIAPPGWWSPGGSSTPTGSGTWPGGATRPAASGCSGSTASAGRRSWRRRSNRPPSHRTGAGFHRTEADPVVVLDLAPAARWVAEQYPNEGVTERPDGILRVWLRVSEQAWLERVLLRVGAHATVVEGDPDLGPAAAARILARYSQ